MAFLWFDRPQAARDHTSARPQVSSVIAVTDGAKLYPFSQGIHFRMNHLGKIAAATLLVALGVAPAAAQTFRPPDSASRPWKSAKMNLGPIYFSPTFELSNVGIDNNVFDDEAAPKQDITGTLGMRSLMGVHVGDGIVLQVIQNNQYYYYRRYRSERSIDSGLNIVLELRNQFFRPWVRYDRLKTSQRVGFEIDERAQRSTPAVDFGIDINAAFRLGVSGAARRNRLRFKDDESFNGQNLSQVLDQQNDIYQGLVRYQLTELTDVVVGADYSRDRFQKTPERDNDSWLYYGGMRIKTGGTFTGTATVGYRQQFHKLNAIPDFKGVTTDVGMSVQPAEGFKLDIGGNRDMAYSYLVEYPFLIDQGTSMTITSRFSEHFDVLLLGRIRWLKYDQTMTGGHNKFDERTLVSGMGAGYFIGGVTRLGLQFEHWQRQSPIDGHSYSDNRVSTNYRFAF